MMAKCNIHGRGEACYSKMLEKAKEKITKLKVSMLQKCNQELRLITNQNESKLQQLSNHIHSKQKGNRNDVTRTRDYVQTT